MKLKTLTALSITACTTLFAETPRNLDELVQIQTPIFAQNTGVRIKTYKNPEESIKIARILQKAPGHLFLSKNTTATIETDQNTPYIRISGSNYSGVAMEIGTPKPLKEPTTIKITADIRVTDLNVTPPATHGKISIHTRTLTSASNVISGEALINKPNNKWTPITFKAEVQPGTKALTFGVGFTGVTGTIDIKNIQISNNP